MLTRATSRRSRCCFFLEMVNSPALESVVGSFYEMNSPMRVTNVGIRPAFAKASSISGIGSPLRYSSRLSLQGFSGPEYTS